MPPIMAPNDAYGQVRNAGSKWRDTRSHPTETIVGPQLAEAILEHGQGIGNGIDDLQGQQ